MFPVGGKGPVSTIPDMGWDQRIFRKPLSVSSGVGSDAFGRVKAHPRCPRLFSLAVYGNTESLDQKAVHSLLTEHPSSMSTPCHCSTCGDNIWPTWHLCAQRLHPRTETPKL